MADLSLQMQRVDLTEVSDDDEEVALVTAATKPAIVSGKAAVVQDDKPVAEVNLSLGPGLDSHQKSEAQMNGMMVLALLDKIIGVVDQIQQTQNTLETRQEGMEKCVSGIQGEMSKMAKSHNGTANTVNKMLEKVRKINVNVKSIRADLEKQAGQIKRLESNEHELLKRKNFKVLIFQDQMKPVKKGEAGLQAAGETAEKVPDEEGKEKASDEEVEIEEIIEESRAERIKRSSLQRVDNIKKAFSKDKMEKTKQKTKENLEKTRQRTRENLEKTRQRTRENLAKTKHSLEKKMGKLSTRLTPTTERKEKLRSSHEKIKKSLKPDHTIYARSKSTTYRVPPFTFHVKKIRDGEVEIEEVEVKEEEEEGPDTEEHGEAIAEEGEGFQVEVEEGELVNLDSPEMAELLAGADASKLVLMDANRTREKSGK
ncbi:caveolae-associated protein 1 [Denticeps clupeoides]|uniref:Polymerase I and transcript release factor n=1 Tax=Denticeps clupeoides TaxID=299321 RepID=A0AAY4CUA9_9TELE|nr:caveolae-associated protein 1-like [Denticeps clupeoides]